MTNIAYIRVSTDHQDETSQREIIIKHCYVCNRIPLSWLSDTASGGIPWQERGLAIALGSAKKGDCIIVSEISRIARSTVGVLTFLQAAAEKGVEVIAIKTGITLDNSMSSKIVVTILGLAAEIERDLLRARTKAAIDARKRINLPVGRQVGALGRTNKLAGREREISELLDKKISKAGIARMLGVSRQTVHTFCNTLKEVGK